MSRRHALLILLSLLSQGLGNRGGGSILVDLNLFGEIRVRFGKEEQVITGESLWKALRG